MSATKTCTKCKQEKELTEFAKHKGGKLGLCNHCKKCISVKGKAYREANPCKIAAQKKAYRESNPEKCKAQCKAYRESNPEKCKAYYKEYHEANKEKEAARSKAYRETNPDKCKAISKAHYEANKEKYAARRKSYREANPDKEAAQQKAWRKANPDKCAAQQKAYYEANPELYEMRNIIRRANRGDIPSLEIYGLPDREMVKQVRTDKLAIFKKYFRKCKYHLDHMRPLAEAKGDTVELHKRSHFSNLVYIPATVNLSKNAKPFWEWFATLTDQKLKKCIAEQDAYNKKVERELSY